MSLARKSRIFCFRGGGKEGLDRNTRCVFHSSCFRPSQLQDTVVPSHLIILPAHLRCARADHCERRYRMNGIAIPFAEANLSTNLIVGRITDQCRYLWWNCSRIRGGFRRWRVVERKLERSWWRDAFDPVETRIPWFGRGLMTIRRDAGDGWWRCSFPLFFIVI